jgi:hypothetical protein
MILEIARFWASLTTYSCIFFSKATSSAMRFAASSDRMSITTSYQALILLG